MKAICSFPDCNKPAKNRGWCWGHYCRWRAHGDPRGIGTAHGAPIKWLLEHVDYPGDDCIVWPFARLPTGHGRIWFRGKISPANRVMCTLAHGDPPSSENVAAHSCGNAKAGCVNPRHLRWETEAPHHPLRGEKSPSSKLTEQQVREIRALRSSQPETVIAKQFGIARSVVGFIHRRERWAWLD